MIESLASRFVSNAEHFAPKFLSNAEYFGAPIGGPLNLDGVDLSEVDCVDTAIKVLAVIGLGVTCYQGYKGVKFVANKMKKNMC